VNTISEFNTLKFIILVERMWGYLAECLEGKMGEPLKNVSWTNKKDVQTATAFCQNIPRKKYVVHVMSKAHLSF